MSFFKEDYPGQRDYDKAAKMLECMFDDQYAEPASADYQSVAEHLSEVALRDAPRELDLRATKHYAPVPENE